MKTKTLLIAAAALAAGVMSSQAQVYSQNVVGYVNVVCPAKQFVFLANPLTTGNDVLTNVITGVPGASTLQYWTGTTWASYTYSGPQKKWLNGAVDVSNTQIPPGVGFFFYANSAFTNTFVGSIAADASGYATNNIQVGYQPVGSIIPFADVVTNSSTINLQVAGASTLQKWDAANQQFQLFTYSGPQKVWKQGAVTVNPAVTVGEGFFINPTSATNWVEKLQ
jgi:hypothetical protein